MGRSRTSFNGYRTTLDRRGRPRRKPKCEFQRRTGYWPKPIREVRDYCGHVSVGLSAARLAAPQSPRAHRHTASYVAVADERGRLTAATPAKNPRHRARRETTLQREIAVKNVSLGIFDPSLGIFYPARCRRNPDFLGGFPPKPRSVLRNRQGIPRLSGVSSRAHEGKG